jgi:hypothetical protein
MPVIIRDAVLVTGRAPAQGYPRRRGTVSRGIVNCRRGQKKFGGPTVTVDTPDSLSLPVSETPPGLSVS